MRSILSVPALVVALASVQPALARDDAFGGKQLNVPHAEWLSPQEITGKLVDKGYKVREIETDDGAYEVDMVDKNGVRMEVHVHPATGEILVGYDD